MNLKSNGLKILSLIFVLSILISILFVDTALAADIEDNPVAAEEVVTEIGATSPEPVEATAPEAVEATSPVEPTGKTVGTAAFTNIYKVVTTKATSLYKSNSTNSAVVKKLSKGTALYVTNNSSGNWVKVKDGTAISGYVLTKYINKASGSSVLMTCKTTDAVNLRKSTTTNSDVLIVVPKGKTCSVVSNSNTSWTKATYSGKTGYIFNKYVTLIFKIPAAKTEATPPAPTNTATPDTPAKPNKNGTFKLKYTSFSIYKGSYFQNAVTSNSTGESIKYSSSNKNVVTVDSYGILYGKGNGSATITAKTTNKTVKFTVKVISPSFSVNISNKTYTTNRYKTVYLGSSTGGVTWQSTDTNKATVSGGLVKCKKSGKVVILAKKNGGWGCCVMTIKAGEAVRFTYANPNSAPKNSTVKFVAITDKSRSDVKFEVTKGNLKYTVKASSKKASGDTYVWTGSKKLTSAGSYSVVAYSKNGSSWSKSTGSYGKAFVTSVTSDSATSCEKRHASNKIISFISNYEGFLSSAIFDPLTSFPCLTVGYGRVIYVGESFYNGMTKDEAMAYLVESVENDGYVKSVNDFLVNHKIKFNQYQFDSLVSLVYNCGPGVLTSDTDIQSVLFNSRPSTAKSPTKGKIAAKCSLRKTSNPKSQLIKTLSVGTNVTLVNGKIVNGAYYAVKDSSGAQGYISYKALSFTSFSKSGTRDLLNISKNNYIQNFFCYHHAGGTCYYGLLYRRIDECEIFFHGDYTRDGEKNKYNFKFSCYSHNPGFGC